MKARCRNSNIFKNVDIHFRPLDIQHCTRALQCSEHGGDRSRGRPTGPSIAPCHAGATCYTLPRRSSTRTALRQMYVAISQKSSLLIPKRWSLFATERVNLAKLCLRFRHFQLCVDSFLRTYFALTELLVSAQQKYVALRFFVDKIFGKCFRCYSRIRPI